MLLSEFRFKLLKYIYKHPYIEGEVVKTLTCLQTVIVIMTGILLMLLSSFAVPVISTAHFLKAPKRIPGKGFVLTISFLLSRHP